MDKINCIVEMVCSFDIEGNITPKRFRFTPEENGTLIVVHIDKFKLIEKKKNFLREMEYFYKCKSILEGQEKLYRLKYNLQKQIWTLMIP